MKQYVTTVVAFAHYMTVDIADLLRRPYIEFDEVPEAVLSSDQITLEKRIAVAPWAASSSGAGGAVVVVVKSDRP